MPDQIIGEGAIYRLRFENNPVLPIVSVFAQAPTEAEALALANAVPRALGTYIEGIQTHQQTPPSRRVVIRKLGKAIGGVVNQNANIQIGVLVFFVVFGVWCMLIVPAQTIARGWQECVANLGSHWTVDRLIVSHDSPEAVMEWTHWKNASGTALRGAEWDLFEPASLRISEIRAYYAAPADRTATVNELVGFDYAGRGYPLSSAT